MAEVGRFKRYVAQKNETSSASKNGEVQNQEQHQPIQISFPAKFKHPPFVELDPSCEKPVLGPNSVVFRNWRALSLDEYERKPAKYGNFDFTLFYYLNSVIAVTKTAQKHNVKVGEEADKLSERVLEHFEKTLEEFDITLLSERIDHTVFYVLGPFEINAFYRVLRLKELLTKVKTEINTTVLAGSVSSLLTLSGGVAMLSHVALAGMGIGALSLPCIAGALWRYRKKQSVLKPLEKRYNAYRTFASAVIKYITDQFSYPKPEERDVFLILLKSSHLLAKLTKDAWNFEYYLSKFLSGITPDLLTATKGQ